jgi:chemotaxis signal transduction protein
MSAAGDMRIDWAAGRAHLARGAAAWSEALSPSPERQRQILDARARRLAMVPPAPARAGGGALVQFSRCGRRFAIEARFAHAVFRPGECIPVPGAPAPVLGVVAFRGGLLALVELCRLLDDAVPDAGPVREALALGESEREFAVAVDAVSAVAALAGALHAAPRQGGLVRAISAEGTALLDGAALIAETRLGGDTATISIPSTQRDSDP